MEIVGCKTGGRSEGNKRRNFRRRGFCSAYFALPTSKSAKEGTRGMDEDTLEKDEEADRAGANTGVEGCEDG